MSLLKKKVIENDCAGLDQENESGKVKKTPQIFGWSLRQS